MNTEIAEALNEKLDLLYEAQVKQFDILIELAKSLETLMRVVGEVK